jgi:hypothetical protein
MQFSTVITNQEKKKKRNLFMSITFIFCTATCSHYNVYISTFISKHIGTIIIIIMKSQNFLEHQILYIVVPDSRPYFTFRVIFSLTELKIMFFLYWFIFFVWMIISSIIIDTVGIAFERFIKYQCMCNN